MKEEENTIAKIRAKIGEKKKIVNQVFLKTLAVKLRMKQGDFAI